MFILCDNFSLILKRIFSEKKSKQGYFTYTTLHILHNLFHLNESWSFSLKIVDLKEVSKS